MPTWRLWNHSLETTGWHPGGDFHVWLYLERWCQCFQQLAVLWLFCGLGACRPAFYPYALMGTFGVHAAVAGLPFTLHFDKHVEHVTFMFICLFISNSIPRCCLFLLQHYSLLDIQVYYSYHFASCVHLFLVSQTLSTNIQDKKWCCADKCGSVLQT